MTKGQPKAKYRGHIVHENLQFARNLFNDRMDLSDLSICSHILTEFEPGGKKDKIPVSVVRDYFIRRYPQIKNDQKRGRLFKKAFKDIGHKIRRMTPGSRRVKKQKLPAFYYYVRIAHTSPEQNKEKERDTQSSLESLPNDQCQAGATDLQAEIRQVREELEEEQLKRFEAEHRINLLNASMEEKRDEHMMEEAVMMDDLGRLEKALEKEKLRNKIAEEKTSYLEERLSQEQDIRWKAVQHLNKIRPLAHGHIPELDQSHVSDLNKTIGSGTFGRVKLCHYRHQNVAVKDFSNNPKGLSVSKLEKCVLKEANMMLSYKPHPNIVNIFGFMKKSSNLIDAESPGLSLVTEHVNGSSLWTLINLPAKHKMKRGKQEKTTRNE